MPLGQSWMNPFSMERIMSRFCSFFKPAVILIVINVIGLVWIHHDLTAIRPATVMASEVTLSPDDSKADRLRIAFDRRVVLPEAVGKPVEEMPFVLQPHREGCWRWASSDTLEYLFDEPLPPGRRFQLTVTDKFRSMTGLSLDGKMSFEITTAALALVNSKVVAADPEWVTFELNFNQPVAPADLLRHITFSNAADRSGRALTGVQCLTKSPEDRLVVRVPRPPSDHLGIRLDQHLTGVNGDLSLSHTQRWDVAVPQSFTYLSSDVWVPPFDEDVRVSLRFSDQLSLEHDLPAITTTPEVESLGVHRSDHELVLVGKFRPEQRYTVHLPAELAAADGQTLQRDYSVFVDIPARYPRLSFTGGRGILSPGGNLTLDMRAVNVREVEFLVWRVHENNLVAHLHNEWRQATSRRLPAKIVKLDPVQNQVQNYAVSISDLIQSQTGVYWICAQSASPRWAYDETLVTVTDLAITAKSEPDGCLVWVTSLRQGTPVEGVTVKAFSFNNQLLVQAVTDRDGIAHLPYPDSRPDGAMWAIVAQKGDDLSYLRPGDNQWMIDDVDQSGRHYPSDVEVMVYTERQVYRPGDTVHLTGIVRQRDGGVPPAFPFAIKVIRPDGRTFAELTATPDDAQGIFHADILTRTDGQTGQYRFDVTVPGDHEVLGSTWAFVEAFLPQRMRVSATPTAHRYNGDETPEIHVSGRYLWDQPAADVQVKAEATLVAGRYTSQQWRQYTFGTPPQHRPLMLGTVEGRLGVEGKAALRIPLNNEIAPALYTMQITTTVTEPGARSVSVNSSVILDRLNHHVGLRCAGGMLPSPGTPIMIEWVSLTGDDVLKAPGDLKAKLEAVVYESVVRQQDGRRVWQSVQRLIPVKEQTLTATGNAEGAFEVVCPDVGRYRLTVCDVQSGSCTWLDLYSSAPGAPQSLSMADPERLEIVTEKETCRPGETVKVLVLSPVPGTVLATVESDRVTDWQIAEVVNNTAELQLQIAEDLRGSVFVTASVVRAIDPGARDWLPHRAMGMKRLLLDHEEKRIPLQVQAAGQSRPGQTIRVTVTTGPSADPNRPAMVHLWAVDEGLLLPTAFETPDPFAYFFSPRTPAVFTSDLFYQLMPDYERPQTITRIGADGDFDMGKLRRNPVETRYRLPDVIWRHAAAVDPNGVLTVEMHLPRLIGEMRLMASAVDHDRYGRAEKPLTLTSDLIVESNWPRSVAPGDTFEVPVKLFNSTDKPMRITLETAINGPVRITGAGAGPVEIPPDKAITRLLQATADRIGPVEVRITARQVDDSDAPATFTDEKTLRVRPAAALHTEVTLKSIEAGRTVSVEPSDAFVPGTQRLTVSISARPTVQLGPALEKLVHYPYGCAEQTASRVLALLYACPILGDAHQDRIRAMIQAGITRLWSMQTASGGLTCWPGETEPTVWASGYVGLCLLECNNAGYGVDEQFTNELIAYLEAQLQSTNYDKEFQNTRALLCRILSGFGRPPHGWMARLAERKDELDTEAIAHLAAAFHEAGDSERALRLLPTDMLNLTVATTTSGRLTSRLQQYAVWLGVLLDIDPDHELVAPLVTLIMDARRDGCWASTLENAAAITALGRYQVLTAAKEQPAFSGTIAFPDGKTLTFDHTKTLTHTIEDLAGPLTISSEGNGRLYIALSSEGLAKEGLVRPYSRRLSLKRCWLDRTGAPVDPNNIRVGDLVQVQLSMSANERFDNIAIVDALAGGFEVENPRLITSAERAQDRGDHADHTEFLDDRVVLFASTHNGTKTFRYALRATTAGTFVLPPIQASCMYDPSVAALGESATIRILP